MFKKLKAFFSRPKINRGNIRKSLKNKSKNELITMICAVGADRFFYKYKANKRAGLFAVIAFVIGLIIGIIAMGVINGNI